MAETQATKKGAGRGKVAGLTPTKWGLLAVSVVGVWYYLRTRSSTATVTTSPALSGGTTIPTDVGGTSATTTTPTSLAGWTQDALSAVTNAAYSPTQALNDITAWLQGNCVSQAGYGALGGLVATLGVPPGYSTVPTLTVCANSTGGATTGPATSTTQTTTPASSSSAAPGPPPNLPSQLATTMANNGEHIIGTSWDAATRTWLYATQKGGVYTLGPNGQPGGSFFGSYLGLPAPDRAGAARTFSSLVVNADGSYTLVSTGGQDYTFKPGSPQAAVK